MAESNPNRSLALSDGEGGSRRTTAQRRQPSNLQGLLRFAMEATGNEDAPRQPQVLDEARRSFLENAINSLSIDITKELEKGIKLLSDKDIISRIFVDTEVPSQVTDSFANIDEYVSQIDVAIGFFKMGGFSIFPVCLSCENPTVRSSACRLLATLCQNNPYCQSKVLECGYLHTLISMFDIEQDSELLFSLMYAISCIIRHHELCTNTFIKDGLYILEKALQIPNLCSKAAFLLSSIFPENNHIADNLVSIGIVKALVTNLPKHRSPSSEQILCALYTLTSENNPILMEEMVSPNYALKETLTDYLKSEELSSINTDYIEEKEYCENLLAMLFDRNILAKTSLKDQTELSIDR